MASLKVDKSVVFLISGGSLFHSRGPATENALSPNFVFVHETSNALPPNFVFVHGTLNLLFVTGIDEIGEVVSDRYSGLDLLLTHQHWPVPVKELRCKNRHHYAMG